ncbi:hypothetical protein FACS1894162_1290 [Bacteroidia bacterium]|nr:hypothetical protein FACS1894162_1290 [Bacteroidia bacterium]
MAAMLIFSSCTEDTQAPTEQQGGIYGVITDKATGEPIRSAGVQLNPLGLKTTTGNDGQYQFDDLKPGNYSLQATKTGYKDIVNHSITVVAGKTAKGDVQIEKLPASLRVVNDNKQDIDTLDFGNAKADVTRSFGIFNDGSESLTWAITETSDWISKVSTEGGTLKAGATQAVVITINRDSLNGGENKTTIHVTSDNGSKQLTVKAIGENKTLPVLNTLEATNITATTAVFHGKITAVGLPTYTERGFVYSQSLVVPPTIESSIAKLTVAVTDSTSYSANVTDLKLDETYYVRAYAKNSVGTAYSTNTISLKTVAGMPSVTTLDITNKNIAAGTLTFNGTIEAVGDPAYTERGFVYGTTHNPTIDDTKKPASGNGTGAFSVNAILIQEGSLYYVRAYATNVKGTVYGEEKSFDFRAAMPTIETKAATNKNIGAGTATFNGKIVSLGDLTYTERGFVYSPTSNPTIEDTKKVVSGTGTGDFSANITGLSEGNIYYIRSYVTNSKGTVYGENVTLDFYAVMPTLNTQAVSNANIGAGTATFNGTILTIGDPAYTERGFVYATTHNPTIDDTKKAVSGSGTGAFSANITGLTVDQIYYVRSYAKSSKGTEYGAEVNFILGSVMPTLSTQAVTDIKIGAGTAKFNGEILTVGDPAYTERGFVYGTTHNPTIDDNKKQASGNGTGIFSLNVTNIAEGSIYYVRAYAKNSKGTVYSTEDVAFDFHAINPTLSTQAVTNKNIVAKTATFNGVILTIGDPAYIERGFVYGTTPNPTDNKQEVSGIETGAFSKNITGLTTDQTYYVRAYAKTNKTTVYGTEDISFILATVFPSVSTQAVTNRNITAGTATFNGNITNAGTPDYTERGFVYGVMRNPTIDVGTKQPVAGSGTGIFNSPITGLVEGNIYYVRAYATNSKGTVYGEEADVNFNAVMPTVSTQNATVISATSATFNGTIGTIGDPSYSERGFVYGETHNPTLDAPNKKTISVGTGTGTFSANVTGLEVGKNYYIRAYATNSKGTIYASEVSLTLSLATLTTTSATSIALNSATVGGNITNVGNSAYTERGVCYSTSPAPTISNTKSIASGTGTGSYTISLTGLTQNATYYARAYATSSVGTAYGNEISFKTLAPSLPTLTTQQATNIYSGQATMWGTITDVGAPNYTEKGFCYATTQNPTISNSKVVVSGTGTGNFGYDHYSLAANTTYYVRAYATNSIGTAYGSQISFKTLATKMGTVTLGGAVNVTSTGFSLTATITNAGEPSYTQYGIVASKSANPTIANSIDTYTAENWYVNNTGEFYVDYFQMSRNTTYYLRAFVTNSVGTAYSNQITVKTNP